jgi:hypothetical protein
LEALLSGLIDYAGLFPPARLPLAEALANHCRYRLGEDAWMLGRFICPASRLGELAEHGHLFRDDPPLVVSALGRGGADPEEFRAGLAADLADISSCRVRHGGRVAVDVLELRLPANFPASPGALLPTPPRSEPIGELSLFFEPPSLDAILSVLGVISDAPFATRAGLKLRCGGLEAAAFPSCEQLAQALTSCLSAGKPFKATAGLHHPFPRFDPGVPARMHGFVNLFTAGVLASARGIPPKRARAILEDEDPGHFLFDETGLHWQDLHASVQEIARARAEAVLSFGSCSFDEPRGDLRALGWM